MSGRRHPNLVRDCVFSVLLSGSVLGSVLYSNNKYEKAHSRAESLEQEVLMQHDSLDALASGVAGLGSAVDNLGVRNTFLELYSADLREKVADAGVGVDHRNALEATIKVIMFIDNMPLTVSSGTVIYSRETKSGKFTNYVLCAAHPVDSNDFLLPGKTTHVFSYGVVDFHGINGPSEYSSKFVLSDAGRDWALLSFESDAVLPVVKIASNDKLSDIVALSEVFTIGCSLSDVPIMTEGRLQAYNVLLDQRLYWMITAPSIIGNSGGGVYLSSDNELIGVTSRVAIFNDNNVNIPVYHLVIMSPLVGFKEWLDKNDLSFICDYGL